MKASGIKGNWNNFTRKLKKKFMAMTENDLLFIEDKEEELMRKQEQRLARTKEKLHKLISK